jgi:Tol biopolymer transport system component
MVADLVYDEAGDIVGLENAMQITGTETDPGEIAGLDPEGVDATRTVNWAPYWHPAGTFVAYASSLVSHRNYEVFQVRTDGSRTLRLTFTEGFDGLPVFSPDGRWLLWTSQRGEGGTSQIWVAPYKRPKAG